MEDKSNEKSDFRIGFFSAFAIVGAVAAALLVILNLP